jgi:hypothetical protein
VGSDLDPRAGGNEEEPYAHAMDPIVVLGPWRLEVVTTDSGTTIGRLVRRPGWLMLIGGALWAPYGLFAMLSPWGEDTLYSEERGYELVIDAGLYRIYSLPGSLALLLTSAGLLGALSALGLVGGSGRTGRLLARVAVALAVLSLLGAIMLVDPVFTASWLFGSLALGAATFVAGYRCRGRPSCGGLGPALLLLGLAGMFILPLWPLIYAVEVLPAGAGAAFIALFGLGWAVMGYRLSSAKPPRALAT